MAKAKLPVIDVIRDIVTNKTAIKYRFSDTVRPVLIDLFTASAVLAVYKELSEENKSKVDEMIKTYDGFQKFSKFAFKSIY